MATDLLSLALITPPESRLADTLFHEATHATLWVPGSVKFNESFASFVGEEAALRYLVDKHGADSEQVQQTLARKRDAVVYRQLLHEVYGALDEVYRDKQRSTREKLRDKHLVLAALPTRVAALDLQESDKLLRYAKRIEWNNARLAQFRVYNDHGAQFSAVLEEVDGDLLRFIDRIDEITRGNDDPFEALENATGISSLADAEQREKAGE